MVKRVGLISGVVTALVSSLAWAQSQPHPFETLRALERFDKTTVLQAINRDKATEEGLSVKGVKIGDNVLQQAINLDEKGGELGRVRGGTRSDKLKFSFTQAYENTRLEQKVELYFDKFNGFIHQVTATYALHDAYLSIAPIRQQTLSAAVEKFGSPMTMQQAYELSGQQDGEIKFDVFLKGLQSKYQLHPLGLEYFQQRNLSRSTKWVSGEGDYALLHSGFDRCYLWQTNAFNQILTFCFFDDDGANKNSRGVELDLHDFPVKQQIIDVGNPHTQPAITL